MNVDDTGLMDWAFKGLVSVLFVIGGWMWVMLVKATIKNRDELNAHKLDVAANYARRTDLNPIYDYLDEIRQDIKTLIRRKPGEE